MCRSLQSCRPPDAVLDAMSAACELAGDSVDFSGDSKDTDFEDSSFGGKGFGMLWGDAVQGLAGVVGLSSGRSFSTATCTARGIGSLSITGPGPLAFLNVILSFLSFRPEGM